MDTPILNNSLLLPDLSSFIFWDVNRSELDYMVHADWIIRRVFDKGTMEDIYAIVSYYGKEKVGKILTQSATLREPIMYLAAFMFHLKPADFVCYK